MNINTETLKKLPKNGVSFITVDGITCSGKTIYAKLLKKKTYKIFSRGAYFE